MNYNEHKYAIRSSDPLVVFYVVSILATVTILHTRHSLHQTSQPEHKVAALCLIFLIFGFVVEAWPRGSTHVQQRSGARAFEKANIFSQLTVHFFQPIVSLAAKQHILQPSDIVNQLPEANSTNAGYARLSTRWNNAVKRYQSQMQAAEHEPDANEKIKSIKKPSLMSAILTAHWKPLIPVVVMRIVIPLSEYLPPALLGVLLDYIQGASGEADDSLQNKEEKPLTYGLAIAFSIFAVQAIVPMMYTYILQAMYLMSVEVKAALVAMIYRKALRLSPDARRKSSTGAITNHMSVDAALWEEGMDKLSIWITLPFDLSICLFMCEYCAN